MPHFYTLDNIRKRADVFRGYRSGTLVGNVLTDSIIFQVCFVVISLGKICQNLLKSPGMLILDLCGNLEIMGSGLLDFTKTFNVNWAPSTQPIKNCLEIPVICKGDLVWLKQVMHPSIILIACIFETRIDFFRECTLFTFIKLMQRIGVSV